MTFEVEIDGHIQTVSIEAVGAAGPRGGRFRVALHRADGTRVVEHIDARPTDLGLSLVFEEGARGLDVAVTDTGGGAQFVQFPHVGLTAVVDGRRARRGDEDAAAGTGEQRVLAPMPGRVVRVLVKPGDEVQARQGLVVVEAMKMENELVAARPGRVKDVGVTEGQSVQAGHILVTVE